MQSINILIKVLGKIWWVDSATSLPNKMIGGVGGVEEKFWYVVGIAGCESICQS